MVVLLSDMYLTSKQIKELLVATGADINVFDRVIVSSEHDTSKSREGLYRKLLNIYEIVPNHVLHLGDKYLSDYVNARKFGIHAIHYDLDKNKKTKYELEEIKNEKCLGEILALRKQMSFRNKYSNDVDAFWYDFGATILAPIFSVFIEYVVSVAEREGIKNIYPIMRDGYIFGKMLNEYIKKIDSKDVKVKPIYVSRKSTYLASFIEVNKKSIEKTFISSQLTVECFFDRFKVENPFADFSDYPISRTKDILSVNTPGLTVYDEILDHILSVKGIINERIAENRKLLIDYLENNFEINEPFITIDIGYNGTAQHALEKAFLLEKKDFNAIHLILLKGPLMINKVLQGVDIRAFIREEDDKYGFLNSVFFTTLLIESFMFNDLGSALGYEKMSSNKVVPILDEHNIERTNSKERRICQTGIIDFYNEYLDLLNGKPWLREKLKSNRGGIIWLIERFMKYPTADEARYLGEIYTENDFYYKDLKKLCSTEEEQRAKELGAFNYLKSNRKKSNIWVAGVVERVYPHFMAIQLFKKTKTKTVKAMADIAEFLILNKYTECVVYGAGEMGHSLVKMLLACNIRITNIVDRNEELWGTDIEGIEVISFDRSKARGHNVYVIASYAFMADIKKFIQQNHNRPNEVRIIDYTCSFIE